MFNEECFQQNLISSQRNGCNTGPVLSHITIPSAVITIAANTGAGAANLISNSDVYCGAYLNTISASTSNGIISSMFAKARLLA